MAKEREKNQKSQQDWQSNQPQEPYRQGMIQQNHNPHQTVPFSNDFPPIYPNDRLRQENNNYFVIPDRHRGDSYYRGTKEKSPSHFSTLNLVLILLLIVSLGLNIFNMIKLDSLNSSNLESESAISDQLESLSSKVNKMQDKIEESQSDDSEDDRKFWAALK